MPCARGGRRPLALAQRIETGWPKPAKGFGATPESRVRQRRMRRSEFEIFTDLWNKALVDPIPSLTCNSTFIVHFIHLPRSNSPQPVFYDFKLSRSMIQIMDAPKTAAAETAKTLRQVFRAVVGRLKSEQTILVALHIASINYGPHRADELPCLLEGCSEYSSTRPNITSMEWHLAGSPASIFFRFLSMLRKML